MLKAYGVSDVGLLRKRNEDRFAADEQLQLLVVADGMGGHLAGEVASTLAVETITGFVRRSEESGECSWPYGVDPTLSFCSNRLRTAIHLANRRVFRASEKYDEYTGMGTTVVCGLLSGTRLAVGHAGDSRLYVLRNRELVQLTADDTWEATVLPDQADTTIQTPSMRHVLTNVLGARESTDVHLCEHELVGGETILVCSDGLHGVVGDEELCRLLSGDEPLEDVGARLIDAALKKGGRDNVTVVLGRYDGANLEPPVPKPARSLPPTIGRYRVLGRLGKGAMAIVYRAYDDVMERPVAIKVMMADLQDDPEMSARFYREAHAAGQLMHRNIITIFDMGDDDGRPYIVMELLEGQTLGDYIERSDGVLLEDKIALITQVFEGLRPAHSKGIFHRDIKPGNLLVREDGSLKIVDFGIARLMTSSMTVSGLIVGTPDYMSPEQACGREVDQRSDIFSAGAVFYYMLTKRKPFAAPDLPAVLGKVQNEQPLPIRESEAPPALAKVVMKALEKSPAARYQDAGEAIADLARVSRGLAVEASHAEEQARSQRAAAIELAAEMFKLCDQLSITADRGHVDRCDEDIRKRHPAYGDWLDGQTGEPLRHAAAYDVLRAVSAMFETLTAEADLLRHAVSNLERGESTANAGDLASALTYFEATVKAVPACGRAQDAANRLRSLLAQKRAAEDQARALLIEANDAAGRAEWQAVLTLTAEALTADRTNVDAAFLRDRASKALQFQAHDRKRQSEQALKRAEKLARKQRYAEAEQAALEARQYDPDSQVALALEERFRAARLDEERASASARHSAEAIAVARRKFESGARTEALSDLRAFLEREPQSPNASAAFEAWTVEADRLLAIERRRQQATEQAKSAEMALQSDDPERALTLAHSALVIDGTEPLAKNIQRMATARLRERVLAAERKATVERMVETAKGLLSRGQYAAARGQARSAANLLPTEAEPLALLALIEEAELKGREQEQREHDARRRANATAPVIAMAKAAETSQDFVRAGWLAENALALDPDCAEAREIVDRARTKVAANPGLADETVTGADQDTLIINPAAPLWRRIIEGLAGWLAIVMVLATKWRGASEPRVKQS